MTESAELEFELDRRGHATYALRVTFTHAGAEAAVRPLQGAPRLVTIDTDDLWAHEDDPTTYGAELANALFADDDVRSAVQNALVAASGAGTAVRIRLAIDTSAPELHAVRWETLRHPTEDRPLFLDEDVHLSRYLASADWTRIRGRSKHNLRVAVCVANPSDLEGRWGYSPVDVDAHLRSVRSGLSDVERLDSISPTLEGLVEAIREGVDVIYLACHGKFKAGPDHAGQGTAHLLLAARDGTTDRVDGDALVECIRAASHRPSLIMLVSCQSAGSGAAECGARALTALGPRLSAVGVPAVLAMQGDIRIETADAFVSTFFQKLVQSGELDRATAAARNAVRDRADWWAPALFMRLRSGRLWHNSGFRDDHATLRKWPSILANLKIQRVTPVLGPGLLEGWVGDLQELSSEWAEEHGFPLARWQSQDLAYVTQYLAITQDSSFPRTVLANRWRRQIHGEEDGTPAVTSVDDTLSKVWQAAPPSADDAYRVLARLPIPIYITVNPDNLLFRALEEAGRHPRHAVCPWNDDIRAPGALPDDYLPTVEEPLIFHMFGHLNNEWSLVLTEEDYFEFLMGVVANHDLVPEAVRAAIAGSALMFLGFRIDDWRFRLLVRYMRSRPGKGSSRRRMRYSNVAAQVDPDDIEHVDAGAARRYLDSWLGNDDISVYWGSLYDFLNELERRHQAEHA